jgi:hypothetical protein
VRLHPTGVIFGDLLRLDDLDISEMNMNNSGAKPLLLFPSTHDVTEPARESLELELFVEFNDCRQAFVVDATFDLVVDETQDSRKVVILIGQPTRLRIVAPKEPDSIAYLESVHYCRLTRFASRRIRLVLSR